MTTDIDAAIAHLQALRRTAANARAAEHERDLLLENRDALILKAHGEGMSQSEIARATGLTRQTIWQIIHR